MKNQYISVLQQQLLDNPFTGIVVTKSDFIIEKANQFFCTLTGYNEVEIEKYHLFNFFRLADKLSFASVLIKGVKECSDFFFENELLHKAGYYVSIAGICKLIHSKGNSDYYIFYFSELYIAGRRHDFIQAGFAMNSVDRSVSNSELIQKALYVAELATGSNLSYYHTVNAANKTISLQAWSKKTLQLCKVPNLTEHYPLESAGIWADSIRTGKPVIHNDYESEMTKKGVPAGHVPLIRHVSIPVIEEGAVVAVLGAGNKHLPYDREDIELLSIVAYNLWNIVKYRNGRHALENSEANLKSIFNNMEMGVIRLSDKGIIEYVNPAIAVISGYPVEAFEGKQFSDFPYDFYEENMSPEVREPIYAQVVRTGEPVRNKVLAIKAKTSELTKWVVTNVFISNSPEDPNTNKIFMTITDITELKNVREESLQFFTLTIDLLCIADFKAFFKKINPSWSRLLGWSNEELMAKPFFEWVHPDDIENTNKATEHLFEGKSVINFENRYRCKDGTYRWLSWNSFSVVSSKLIYAVARDITNIKHTQNLLMDAVQEAEEGNRVKSEFLANISHEIRTPLNAVIGFSDMLREHLKDDHGMRLVDSIQKAGKNLLTLINDILDLSRLESGRMSISRENVRISTLLEEIRMIFSDSITMKSLSFKLDIHDSVPTVIISDEMRLRQILFNLTGNAVKFTHAGFINIKVRMESDQTQFICFDVEDSGIGIPEQDFEIIFEEFRQQSSAIVKKYGGSGLGLSISRKLARLLGGELFVVSNEGSGSCFTLRLPAELPKNLLIEEPFKFISKNDSPSLLSDEVLTREPVSTELLKLIREDLLKAVSDGRGKIILSEITALANRLTNIAELYSCKQLKEYAYELDFAASEIEMDKIHYFLLKIEDYFLSVLKEADND